MNTSTTATQARGGSTEKFYLPAVTAPSSKSRVAAFVEDLFDFHGVVLIPDSYDR